MTMYMKVPGISGDVTTKGYDKFIEIENIDFSAKRVINTQAGQTTKRQSAQPVISELKISKRMDQTSPYLFQEAVVGKDLGDIEVDFTLSGQDSAYAKLTFSGCMISGYQLIDGHGKLEAGNSTSSEGVDAHPLENLTINFNKVQVRFTPRDSAGKVGSPASSGYDLVQADKM